MEREKIPVFYVMEEFMRIGPAPLFAGKTLAEAQLWIEENRKNLGPFSILTIKKEYI